MAFSRHQFNINAPEFVPRAVNSRNFQRNHHFNPRPAAASNNDPGGADNLRIQLADELRAETYECMICCDRVRWTHPVWSCNTCHHVFHLRCAKKWAASSGNNENGDFTGWRCPGCQTVNENMPSDYVCFCGKTQNPNYFDKGWHQSPHSCDNTCQKRLGSRGCEHSCSETCHPGPCPPCPRTVDKKCYCGTLVRRLRCGAEDFQCGKPCGKWRNCCIHKCDRSCHEGNCEPCQEQLTEKCYCDRTTRTIVCGSKRVSLEGRFSCEAVCDKLLSCGKHKCERTCHEGDCAPCALAPSVLYTCWCGKTSLDSLNVLRTSCDDPVPSCDKTCEKTLPCGSSAKPHKCASQCHAGKCPPCPLTTEMTCRCGANTKNVDCNELFLYNAENPLLCERRCTKKRSCKSHKCGEICCVDNDHICMLICGRTLSCGIHNCEMLCHNGKCRPCQRASFDELTCACGKNVIFPPVACGTKPPACTEPCPRTHSCDHPVTHQCSSDTVCPPCTYLVAKPCYGGHELRRNIPCYLNDVSCGKPCGKPLECGQHGCIRICHSGECATSTDPCARLCTRPRPSCGHHCASKCHGDSQCPESLCQALVKVSCPCGNRFDEMLCHEIERLFQRSMAAKVAKAEASNEVDLQELEDKERRERNKCLECSEECMRIARNRRFAEALQLDTGDFVGDLGFAPYIDYLKEQYKLNPNFLLSVEKTLCDLMSSLKSSNAAERSHAFPPMKREQRRVIHEYAQYFRIETIAYDQEPKRNIVATAKKNISVNPPVLLSAVMQKETGKATKVVPPQARNLERTPVALTMKTLTPVSSTIIRR